ncbi:MAG TPA: twin-arginine translocase TatA/TatE family subunit [Thermoanaerobaculia bacterium]
MPNLGLPELLLILAIVVILFGAGKLPQLGKGLGEGIRNFKQSMKDGDSAPKEDDKRADDGKPKQG